MEDVWAPDNTIYYLNSRYVRMEYLPAELSVAMFPSDEALMLGGLSDGFETIPLGIMMELLAKTGDSQKAYLKCYPQLVVERLVVLAVDADQLLDVLGPERPHLVLETGLVELALRKQMMPLLKFFAQQTDL